VLFVEDSKILQRSVATALRKSGYAVDVTGDGNEGLWYAQSHEYDVIILDRLLPGLDGLTILQRLRQQGQTTQVLLLTAKDTVEDRVCGLRTGADDYLIKPFALDELLARVQALCRRQEFVLEQGEDVEEVIGLNECVTVAYGSFNHCVKVQETTALGTRHHRARLLRPRHWPGVIHRYALQ
jgi:DNA-binding response OmpR family regulator